HDLKPLEFAGSTIAPASPKAPTVGAKPQGCGECRKRRSSFLPTFCIQAVEKGGTDHPEYAPDFVAEIESCVLMIETKSQAEMTDTKMQAKADAAVKRCENTSDYLMKNGGKPWKYLLIPHDKIKENYPLEDYAKKFEKI
ncbi:MAG: hypothetical protein ACXW0G_08010, partial [Methylosarcina sp.]